MKSPWARPAMVDDMQLVSCTGSPGDDRKGLSHQWKRTAHIMHIIIYTHMYIYIFIYIYIHFLCIYIYKYIIIYTYNYIYIYNYIHLQYHTCDQRFWVRLTATSNQVLSDSACGKTKHPALDPGTGMVIENKGMHDHCCVHVCHNSITINP